MAEERHNQSGFGLLSMMRGVKKIRFCLVVAVVFSLLLGSAFFHYFALEGADFISRDLKLEAFDQDLSIDSCDKFKIFGIIGLDRVFYPDTIVFKQLSICSFQASPLVQTPLVLRC
jgi:hypothetical protein